MNLDEIAIKIDAIAVTAGDDPFEIFRAATSGERIVITDDEAVDQVETLIADLSQTDLARLDRMIFNSSTGQNI